MTSTPDEAPHLQSTPDRSVPNQGPSSAVDVAMAASLAFLAGVTDVYGVARLHDLFVSFMSGNTTMLGLALGRGDWERVRLIGFIVGLFVAGAALGAIIEVRSGRHHVVVVVGVVALILLTPCAAPEASVPAFVVAMGALNAAIARVGPAAVSLTYVTGTLVKFGQGLGRALCGRSEGWAWLLQLPMWFALLAGVALGERMQVSFDRESTWPPAAIAGLAFVLVVLSRAEHVRAWRLT